MHASSAASIYAGRGMIPLPLNWIRSDGACSCQSGSECGTPGKHPKVRWKALESPADPGTIENWWRWWPKAGVGIKTGAVSGIFVLDVDPRHGGDHSLQALEDAHGPLPDTLRALTGGGGQHIYFAHPGGEIRNDVGSKLGAGLDVRGDGGMVAAPPTQHASGRRYRWENWPGRLAPAPGWLVAALRPPPAPAPRVPVVLSRRGQGYGEAALAREVERLSMAATGDRNHQLFRSAAALGELVGAGVLADWRAAQAMLGAALSIGLGEAESRQTILSGLNTGAKNPRAVSA